MRRRIGTTGNKYRYAISLINSNAIQMAKKDNTNTTKNFIIRIDSEMMEAIEKWAADEFRSTNGQIQYILDQALRKAGRLKKSKSPDA